MDIELRHLRVVCAIAETGSVTKAAAQLGLAQPALTAQLQRIERALGGPLFERDRRGARPTPLGELVLARARLLIPAFKGLRDEANRLAGVGKTTGRYRIGAGNGPILAGLVQRLTTAYPLAHVSTYTSFSQDELAEMVAAGRLDFALMGFCGDSTPTAEFGLVWSTVCVDAVCVLLSDQHSAANGTDVDLADLADVLWANVPGDGCFSECFAAACARAGFTPRHIFETDVSACADLVVSGTAVALCQGTSREPPGIRMVPIAGTPLRWRHVLAWHPDSVTADVADDVGTHAVAAYLDTVGRRPRYAEWLRANPRFGAGQRLMDQLSR
ncbi:MAG TPA: LysR family transcriptional regulator [Micromonosporaceae bacterium]|nr:LysR family transcriptional regulator [Micromonosporaceae bacterium]